MIYIDGKKLTKAYLGETRVEAIYIGENMVFPACSKGLEYEYDSKNKTYTVTGIGTCEDTIITIPRRTQVVGYPEGYVTAIGKNCFKNIPSIDGIYLQDTITSIGRDAFSGSTILNKVNYLGTLDQWCQINFANGESNPLHCSQNFYVRGKHIDTINLQSTTTINKYAFYGCFNLETVIIGQQVTLIDDNAFMNCSKLENLQINSTQITISNIAFDGCQHLQSDYQHNRYIKLTNSDGTKNDYGILTAYNGLDNIHQDTKYIARNAGSTYLQEHDLTIPDNVISISNNAFYGTKIVQLTIGSGVQFIGSRAFSGQGVLENIAVDSSNQRYFSMYSCLMKNDTENNKLTLVFGCKTSTLPDKLSLSATSLGKTQYDIENFAFYHMGTPAAADSFGNLIIPDSVASIGSWAFCNCALSTVFIPESVMRTGYYIFGNNTNADLHIYSPLILTTGEICPSKNGYKWSAGSNSKGWCQSNGNGIFYDVDWGIDEETYRAQYMKN